MGQVSMGQKVNRLTDLSVEWHSSWSPQTLPPWSEFVMKVVVTAIVLMYASFGKVGMYIGRELSICVIKYVVASKKWCFKSLKYSENYILAWKRRRKY
jgi:hypothetical protein